jgi:hypothetical protein
LLVCTATKSRDNCASKINRLNCALSTKGQDRQRFGLFLHAKIFCSKTGDVAMQMNHRAVMELRRRNAISSAASDKALGSCLLRNQEKNNDDHFQTRPDRRHYGCGQSFDPDAGTGNVLAFSYGPMGAPNDTVAVRQTHHGKIARRQSGLRAFARVPGGAAGGDSNDPALTGGGSLGYNQTLEQF